MAHPYHHAVSSARQFGGRPEDYQAIHDWFDATKKLIPDIRHRALRHHAEGIFLCEEIFGTTIDVLITRCPLGGDPAGCGSNNTAMHEDDPDGFYDCFDCGLFFRPRTKKIPVRWVGEQHVREDLGFIPPAEAWLRNMKVEAWMSRSRKLSRELEEDDGRRIGDVPSANVEAALAFRAQDALVSGKKTEVA